MRKNAYAKINLGLHVTGKRSDGFHDIRTIFHRINLFDVVEVAPSEEILLSCSDPAIPAGPDNLCWKAVELLRKELQTSDGAAVAIKKNIPVGAGLGGGSSDAAAVLQLLPGVWNKTVPPAVLHSVAARIGSDVPFFLLSGSAYGEGRGELLTPIALSLPYWILLINPNIHISTPWAYGKLSEQFNGHFPVRTRILDQFNADPLGTVIASTNDFEPVVFAEHSKIKKLKIQLKELGAVLALMSGSGSSMFGLFDDMISALKAVEFFNKEHFVHLTEPNFSPL